VSGRRRERQEAFLSRVLPSRIANWLIARATGVPVHDTGCGLKVYRRAVVTGARLPRGMNRFLPAVLGVRPARVAEEWVTTAAAAPGGRTTGSRARSPCCAISRAADPGAAPAPARFQARARRRARGAGRRHAVLILSGLGWPAGPVPAIGAALAALLGWRSAGRSRTTSGAGCARRSAVCSACGGRSEGGGAT